MNVYERSIQELKARGWQSGGLISQYDGRVCALGALALGMGAHVENDEYGCRLVKDRLEGYEIFEDSSADRQVVETLAEVIREQHPEWLGRAHRDAVGTIYNFNDSHSEEEVMTIFEKAAQL